MDFLKSISWNSLHSKQKKLIPCFFFGNQLEYHGGLYFLRTSPWTSWFTQNPDLFDPASTHTVNLGSTHNLSLCWGLHGGVMSLMVKKGSASYIVPGCMSLMLQRSYTFLFSLQTASTKCIGSDLPVKWAVPNLAFFSYGCTERIRTAYSKFSGTDFHLLVFNKKINPEPRSPFFPDFVCWALLLKKTNSHNFVKIGN